MASPWPHLSASVCSSGNVYHGHEWSYRPFLSTPPPPHPTPPPSSCQLLWRFSGWKYSQNIWPLKKKFSPLINTIDTKEVYQNVTHFLKFKIRVKMSNDLSDSMALQGTNRNHLFEKLGNFSCFSQKTWKLGSPTLSCRLCLRFAAEFSVPRQQWFLARGIFAILGPGGWGVFADIRRKYTPSHIHYWVSHTEDTLIK